MEAPCKCGAAGPDKGVFWVLLGQLQVSEFVECFGPVVPLAQQKSLMGRPLEKYPENSKKSISITESELIIIWFNRQTGTKQKRKINLNWNIKDLTRQTC
jgi:hypothetical protein